MAKTTAAELNQLYVDFAADPVERAGQFWSALRAWVVRCDYLIPLRLKDDLVQDTVLEIMTNLYRFKQGTNFTWWANAIIRNMRSDCFRINVYEREAVPFSELAKDDGDGNVTEYEPSTACPSDESDLLLPEEIEAATTAKLDTIRSGLKKSADLQLFDLLRTGKSITESAEIMGQPFRTVQSRFHALKKKLEGKPNPCIEFPECNSVRELQRAA